MLSHGFHPKRLYPSGWRGTELGLKTTRKRTRAHRHDLCQRADIQLSSKVRSGPDGEVTHPIRIYVLLLRKQLTVLRLVAGASQEEHEVPGNRGGHCVAKIFFDQRESQINARTHSCRGVELPIFHEYWISFYLQTFETAGEQIAISPMGSYAPAVKQARGSEEKCAGAHRCNSADARRPLAKPFQHVRSLMLDRAETSDNN